MKAADATKSGQQAYSTTPLPTGAHLQLYVCIIPELTHEPYELYCIIPLALSADGCERASKRSDMQCPILFLV